MLKGLSPVEYIILVTIVLVGLTAILNVVGV